MPSDVSIPYMREQELTLRGYAQYLMGLTGLSYHVCGSGCLATRTGLGMGRTAPGPPGILEQIRAFAPCVPNKGGSDVTTQGRRNPLPERTSPGASSA